MKKKFTIITIVKNDKFGILKTLKSISRQTFKNFEHIVVDGNSSDGTLFQIREYNKKNKFLFFKRKDISFYDSLNFAIKKSCGEFIGILNSGDTFVNNNVLEKINKSISSTTNIFYSNLFFVKKKKIVRIWKHRTNNISKFNLFKIPHTTLFVHNRIYKKIGLYNLNYKISSDLDFIIRLNKKINSIKHLNFETIFMEYGGLSTNLKSFKLKIREDFSILIYHFKSAFIFYYIFKIYFKINDFNLRNYLKS